MMTKDEERAVLKKIAKLIESTGEGSYISMAFEGCVEDAESNIEYDFGNSWKIRAQYREELFTKEVEARAAAEAERNIAQKELQLAKETLTQEVARADKFKGLYEEGRTAREELKQEADAAKAEAVALRQQVIELKAMLYDFITQG